MICLLSEQRSETCSLKQEILYLIYCVIQVSDPICEVLREYSETNVHLLEKTQLKTQCGHLVIENTVRCNLGWKIFGKEIQNHLDNWLVMEYKISRGALLFGNFEKKQQ